MSPKIKCAPNGPLLAHGLETLENSKGASLETKETVALCRCGESANKPFCDGAHAKAGFSDERQADGNRDERVDYVGEAITVHDNRGVCSHSGECTSGLPSVWRMQQEPWIDPDGASVEDVIATVRKCPSGALSYTVDGVEHKDWDGEPRVLVTKDGPYAVSGGVELEGVAFGKGVTREHYALCRCGHSGNKPFCDGAHWRAEFRDEGN